MIYLYAEKKDCCGCSACFNICPSNAISMVADTEGFLYPVIDREKCIDCFKCKEICPFVENYKTPGDLSTPLIYAAKHKNDVIRELSSSGGMFTAISDYVLALGGVVYGVVFDHKLRVCHTRATTQEERDPMRGAKYVQSELGDIFKQVRADLLAGKKVLFTGTPCQNAGLFSFLGDGHNDLILCDFLCHSVPSPRVFADYLATLDRDNLRMISFRDKTKGWHAGSIKFQYLESSSVTSHSDNSFLRLFFGAVISRPACHNCKFTNFRRPSDITIADFWGIEKVRPQMDDDKGTSLIIISSSKGSHFFKEVRLNLVCEEVSYEECLQRSLTHPLIASSLRDTFFRDYCVEGFAYVVERYMNSGVLYNMARMVKRLIKKNIRIF